MSVIIQSRQISNYQTINSRGASNAPTVMAHALIKAQPAANNVVEMLVVPPYHHVHDLWVGVDAAINGTVRVGDMIGKPGDPTFANRTTANKIGNEYIGGFALPVAGGRSAASDLKFSGLVLPASETERSIGVQFDVAPDTFTPGSEGYVVMYLGVVLRPTWLDR